MTVDIPVDTLEDKSWEAQIQAEGGGVMTPNHNPLIYLSTNTLFVVVSVDTT